MENVVYVGGIKCDNFKHAWYQVDLESLKRTTRTKVEEEDDDVVVERKWKKGRVLGSCSTRNRPMSRWVTVKRKVEKKNKRIQLATAAQIKDRLTGSPIVIGDDLYWYGLTKKGFMDLLKTDVTTHAAAAKPFSWKTLSSSPHAAISHITVFPIAGKLYALCGVDNTQEFNLCGQIYDLGTGTWEYFKCNISTGTLSKFYLAPYVALSENKTEFVFYSMLNGSVLYFDVASHQLLRKEDDHDALVLWGTEFVFPVPPRGLENCSDFRNLVNATLQDPARLRNNILYWLDPNLYLFGYDLNLRRWFQSSSLREQFPWRHSLSHRPFLLDLPNGKLLAVVPERRGDITVAPLTVSLDADSLIVTVESFYPFSVDADDFIPFSELSELKNAWSDTMCGPVKSAMET